MVPKSSNLIWEVAVVYLLIDVLEMYILWFGLVTLAASKIIEKIISQAIIDKNLGHHFLTHSYMLHKKKSDWLVHL